MRLFACIIALSFASLVFSQTTVRLINATPVQGPYVELGEIAKIDTDDVNLKKQLLELVVTDAPSAGASRLISSYMISSLLDQQGIKAEVYGTQSQVKTEERIVASEEMEKAIHLWINNNINKSSQAGVEVQSLPHNWVVPLGDNIEIVAYNTSRQFGHPINITFRAVSDGKILSNSHGRIKISLFAEAPVVVSPVKKGEIISNNHVRMQRADVSKINGMEVANLDQIIGMEAKHDLKIDSLISANEITSPILIEKGSLNRLLVINGNIQMNLSGAEALQAGRKGETISFKNPLNSKETICAKVTKEGNAVIKIR